MKTYYALLLAGGKIHRVFALDLPDQFEPKGYHTGISLGAFRKNEQRRRFPHLFDKAHKDPAPFGFQIITQDEYDDRQGSFDQIRVRFPELNMPEYERGDGVKTIRFDETLFELERFTVLFDFYRHIGYDRIRKKYRPSSQVMSWLS